MPMDLIGLSLVEMIAGNLCTVYLRLTIEMNHARRLSEHNFMQIPAAQAIFKSHTGTSLSSGLLWK